MRRLQHKDNASKRTGNAFLPVLFLCLRGKPHRERTKCEIFVKKINLFHPYHFLIKTMTVFIEHLLIKKLQENSLIFCTLSREVPIIWERVRFIPNQKNSDNKNWSLSKNFHLIMIINVTRDGTDYLGSV